MFKAVFFSICWEGLYSSLHKQSFIITALSIKQFLSQKDFLCLKV
jgi:hypothetical protein